MQLDDRDIVCETDYSPLSSAELAAQIEWHAAAMSGATAYDLERITGPARALLARAEAAEARVADLEAALVGMDGHMARLISERNDALDRAEAAEAERDNANIDAALEQSNAREAWQRVAELEAQLAAQGWRPGSEKPNMPEWYQVGDIDVGVYELWYSGEAWYRSPFQGATYRTPPLSAPDFWRPIPPLPAPDAQEPTP